MLDFTNVISQNFSLYCAFGVFFASTTATQGELCLLLSLTRGTFKHLFVLILQTYNLLTLSLLQLLYFVCTALLQLLTLSLPLLPDSLHIFLHTRCQTFQLRTLPAQLLVFSQQSLCLLLQFALFHFCTFSTATLLRAQFL
jgi:hypothetical protein